MLSGQGECQAKRKDGQPCQSWALPGGRFCFWHSPERAPAQAAARKLGGQHRRRGHGDPSFAERMQGKQFRTLADVEGLLEGVIVESLKLENSVARNRCLGYLCGVWSQCHQAGEIEMRLAALEQLAGANKN